MPVTAKICGVRDVAALDAAVAGGASHIGLMFYPPSPRQVSPGEASGLIARLPERTMPVAVMVDPDDALIDSVMHAGVRALQLHGQESADRVAAIRNHSGLETWKVVPVKSRADLDAAKQYRGAADRILYDAKTPKGALPGGMGVRFDWSLLDGFAHLLPWALSGGLDAGNVADAVGRTGARLVDVSSGVERAPGVKDVDLIATFLQAVRRL